MNERNKKEPFFFFCCCWLLPNDPAYLIVTSAMVCGGRIGFFPSCFSPAGITRTPSIEDIISLSLYSSCIQKYPAATFSLSGSLVARGRATLISGELGFVPCRFYLVNNLQILFFCKRKWFLSFFFPFCLLGKIL